MRIIAGRFKSRRLARPHWHGVRPMMDRVKESLFGHLGAKVEGSRVLDLFAGSGSLGLEALSRGARSCVFVEESPAALAVLRRNVQTLAVGAQAKMVRGEVLRALARLARQGGAYDLIFSDPPYNKGLVKKTLLALDASDILRPDSWVVVGHARQEPPEEALQALVFEETRFYGQACLSFFYHPEVKP